MAFHNELVDVNWSEPFEMASTTSDDSIPEDCIRCLQKSFGHSRFRELQWKIISSILDDARDNCVIMATGYGKSLCYQFPSVYRDTITIVVSPLISLMQDQVREMSFYNLRACFLGSAQTCRDKVFEVIEKQYNIVYVTPEYITSESGSFLLERIREHLTLIAIDEAHCISKWGHDFRHAYRNLNRLRTLCPSVPILAMTATATEKVRYDIVESLELRNAQILVTGFDRPNLEFIIKQKTDIWADIGSHIANVKIGSVIIYCISRRVTEEVAAVLIAHGILCGVYHAGINLKQRQKTHNDFIHDRIRVVVATIAFGMGINKPDVRLVIHYGVAKDVESYYQEVGRAGRDGLPAKCLMLYHKRDWTLHRFIREKCTLKSAKEQMENLMLAMSQYVDNPQCRRRFILSYFGDDCSKLPIRPDCCDNCRRTATKPIDLFSKYQGLSEDGSLDITNEAFKMLTLMRDMTAKYGLRKAFLVLRGSKSKSVPPMYSDHPLFGSLKDKSEKWLEAVGNSLLHMKMLAMIQVTHTHTHPRCTITGKGRVWLSSNAEQEPLKVVPGEEFIRLLKPKILGTPKILFPDVIKKTTENVPSTSNAAALSSATTTTAETSSTSDIYRPLLRVRLKLARLFDAMPYLVASTRALEQLAQIQPTTMEELRTIRLDGYSEEKTERFGPVFLKVIRDYHVKMGKSVRLEKKPSSEEETVAGSQKSVAVKIEPIVEGTTNQTSSTASEIIYLSSDEDDESLSPKQKNHSNGDAKPKSFTLPLIDITPMTPENGEVNKILPSSQDSVEIIEPTPPPIIEIESDIENAIFTDWDSDDDDKKMPQVCPKIKEEHDDINDSDNENNELNLLIDALESEYLDKKQKNRHIVQKTSSTVFEYENTTDSDADIFDGAWDLDIDESDLTQISQEAEEKLKTNSIKLFGNSGSPPCDNLSALTIDEGSAELDLFIKTVKSDLNQSSSIQGQRKARVIEIKTSKVFEYEDDSSSDSEGDTKVIVSPKKRSLPSWMQVSNKRKR